MQATAAKKLAELHGYSLWYDPAAKVWTLTAPDSSAEHIPPQQLASMTVAQFTSIYLPSEPEAEPVVTGLPESAQEALEAIIDEHSLGSLTQALAAICRGKAEHIRVNWSGSQQLARHWDRAAARFEAMQQLTQHL